MKFSRFTWASECSFIAISNIVWVSPLNEASHLGLLLHCDSSVTMPKGRWKGFGETAASVHLLGCFSSDKKQSPYSNSSALWPGFPSDGIKGSSCCPLIMEHKKYKPSFCCSLFWSRWQLQSQPFSASVCFHFFSLRITLFLKTNKHTSSKDYIDQLVENT